MENMNQRRELPQSRPPDRAAVERLIQDIGKAWAGLSPPTEDKLIALWRLLCESENTMHNLLQRLELAEQEKAEAVAQREDLRDVLLREGYRRCDIAACNCNGWHGGHAMARLNEIGDALEAAGVSLNGSTILKRVQGLAAQRDEAVALIKSIRQRVHFIAACANRSGSCKPCDSQLAAIKADMAAYDAKESGT